MQVSEIRPQSTYMGHGGLIRRAQSIQMDVDGALRVAWKAVRLPRDAKYRSTSGFTGIEEFAAWALTVTETLSEDLRHYLP